MKSEDHFKKLERKRPTLLLIGLTASLLLTLGFFNLSTKKKRGINLSMPVEYASFIEIPVTKSGAKKEKKNFSQTLETSNNAGQQADPFELLKDPFAGDSLMSDSLMAEPILTTDRTKFMIVEEMPEFPGGEEAFINYLAQNIIYPRMALDSHVEGIVYVSFVIGFDGDAEEVAILSGIGSGCDQEAIRVIDEMPHWKPGKQRGKPARVIFQIPINFSLR